MRLTPFSKLSTTFATLLCGGICGGIFFIAPTHAKTPHSTPAQLALSAGAFDIFSGKDSNAHFTLEYRATPFWRLMRPIAGVRATSEGGLYGYGGAQIDLPLSENWLASPSLALGVYEQGNAKDLGHWLQFRSGFEIGYRIEKDQRLSISFDHLSNAGGSNRNPGAETLSIKWSIPMTW